MAATVRSIPPPEEECTISGSGLRFGWFCCLLKKKNLKIDLEPLTGEYS